MLRPGQSRALTQDFHGSAQLAFASARRSLRRWSLCSGDEDAAACQRLGNDPANSVSWVALFAARADSQRWH
jgi:hypothetical protein